MENCERCRKPIDRGATLIYSSVRHRFCSGICALGWNRAHGANASVVISFDPKPPTVTVQNPNFSFQSNRTRGKMGTW